jgi:hypothetical protein
VVLLTAVVAFLAAATLLRWFRVSVLVAVCAVAAVGLAVTVGVLAAIVALAAAQVGYVVGQVVPLFAGDRDASIAVGAEGCPGRPSPKETAARPRGGPIL